MMMILLIIKLLLLLRLRPRFREMKTFLTLVEHREGPEEIAGAAALVGVADELRVELLVPLQRDAALLLVILREELLVGLVQLVDRPVGVPVDAVEAELLDADGAVTVDVDRSEGAINEKLESRGKVFVGLVFARRRNALLKLLDRDLAVLVPM